MKSMDGVKVLNEQVAKVWNPLTIILIVLVIVLAFYTVSRAVKNRDCVVEKLLNTLMVSTVLIVIIHSYASYSSEINSEYVVTVDESVDVEKFDSEYVIINKVDDLYVIRRRLDGEILK